MELFYVTYSLAEINHKNPDCDQYIAIIKNKRRTYDDVNKTKNPKCLNFFISIR